MTSSSQHGSPAAAPTLRRDLGLLDAVGIGFGAIVGAGIFVVTGVAAGIAGPALLIGLLIAGIAAAANALSSAQLAAEYPYAGGTYEYGYRVLSPAAGFAAGWMFLASKLAAAGTVAIGLAGYVDAVLPGMPSRALAVGAIVVFTVLNYFGVKRSSRANLVIVTISVGTLLVFALLAAGSVRMDNLRPFAPAGLGGTLEAAAILFFAYTGYARIATLAEEVRDPKRVIPQAILLTIGGAILLYAAVAFAAVGVVGSGAMAATTAPLYVAAQATGHGWLPVVVAIAGATAMLGVILSQLLGLSRMAFAMARRGDLPRGLEHVHPEYQVPDRAVLVIGGIAAVIAATGTLAAVASTAAFTILVYYGIANVAAMRMPAGAKLYSDVVPIVGLLGCSLLAISLAPTIMLTGSLVLGAGFIVRAAAHSRR